MIRPFTSAPRRQPRLWNALQPHEGSIASVNAHTMYQTHMIVKNTVYVVSANPTPSQGKLADCKTVIWNGPMGVFEYEAFAKVRRCTRSNLLDLAAAHAFFSAIVPCSCCYLGK